MLQLTMCLLVVSMVLAQQQQGWLQEQQRLRWLADLGSFVI